MGWVKPFNLFVKFIQGLVRVGKFICEFIYVLQSCSLFVGVTKQQLEMEREGKEEKKKILVDDKL